MFILYLLLSILAGFTVVIARSINSNLAEKIGTFQGTLINYIVGLTFSFLFLFISNETLSFSFDKMQAIPVEAYFGGVVGVIVIVLSNYTTPRISAFYLTLLVFIGQLFAGILIDYFSFQDLSIGKIIGGLFVLAGLTYNLRIDKKSPSENATK